MNAPRQITQDEIQRLSDASNLKQLEESPAFKRILFLWEDAVAQALEDLERNFNPLLDSHFKSVWLARKAMLSLTRSYLDEVIARRREVVRQLLEDYGFDAERIERNLDADFSFLNKFIGGQNGR